MNDRSFRRTDLQIRSHCHPVRTRKSWIHRSTGQSGTRDDRGPSLYVRFSDPKLSPYPSSIGSEIERHPRIRPVVRLDPSLAKVATRTCRSFPERQNNEDLRRKDTQDGREKHPELRLQTNDERYVSSFTIPSVRA